MKFNIKEFFIVVGLLLFITIAFFSRNYFNIPANATQFVYNDDKKQGNLDISKLPMRMDRLHRVDIEMEPEFIRSMNAAIPVGADCIKVRYKKVPATSVMVDGVRIDDKFFARYRGFCHEHWGFREKSIKLEAAHKEPFWGYRSINLNAFNTDPFLFEAWTSRVLEQTGSLATRIGFIKLFINGEYAGIRQLSENLDEYFLRARGLKMGPIYREVTHADPGRVDRESLKILWQKNTQKNKTWDDLYDFHDKLIDSVRNPDARQNFFRITNLNDYINYYAVVTITGTNHLNNHNIPMYRPKSDSRFSPIGYDFGTPWASQFHELNSVLPMLHVSLLSMNWIHQAFLTEATIRLKIQKRIVEILSGPVDFEKQYDDLIRSSQEFVEYDLKQGFILDNLPDFNKTYAQYSEKNGFLKPIHNRLQYLKEKYLHPTVLIPKNWKTEKKFQVVVDGLGRYILKFSVKDQLCDDQDKIKVKGHLTDWQEIVSCDGGHVVSTEFIISRYDIELPHVDRKPEVERNSIGPIVVDVNVAGNLKLDNVEVKSLQTEYILPVHEDWPFHFEKSGELSFSVTSDSQTKWVKATELAFKSGFTWADVNEKVRVFNESEDHKSIELLGSFKQESSYDLNSWGPVLCWNLANSRNCMEFSKKYILNHNLVDADKLKKKVSDYLKQNARPPEKDSPFKLVQKKIENCKTFSFTSNNWVLSEKLVFPKSCKVSFAEGATLLAENADVYIIVQGPVSFGNGKIPITFTSISEYWGGLVLLNNPQEEVRVQNTIFKKANEFNYNGTRYTGALSIVGAKKYSVFQNQFLANLSDDGLNIKGGIGRIYDNYFLNNRDALDVDVTESLIEYNYFAATYDDSIDCGTANARIQHNYIQSSGDKGVSIGEGSTVTLNNNIIKSGNTGVGVKDSSNLQFENNYITKNQIGLNIYTKIEKSDAIEKINVVGSSVFDGNTEQFKMNGKDNVTSDRVKNLENKSLFSALLKKIKNNCQICREIKDENR